jgi:hypothetical protein
VFLGVLFVGLLAMEESQTVVLIHLLHEVLKRARLAEAALLACEAPAQRQHMAGLEPVECRGEDEFPDGSDDLARTDSAGRYSDTSGQPDVNWLLAPHASREGSG